MLRDKEKSGGSTKRGEVKGVALVDSPTRVAPLTSVKDPPPYGAQHRQDVLWEGGNEALPPRWHQFEVGDDETQYQDDNLVMASWNRPLPGNLLSILRCAPRSLKEPHWTQASLVDEVRIYRSMKTSKPKSSLRRPRFPLACTARQEHRDTARSLLEPEGDENEEDGDGEKQNEGKEDRERARREELR
ncbi:hypothetical protein M405DRAFT_858092 [Rhizopogon salebrosus TDB-379]|nr:hypothetical protein M405DRAFT_858092 [Rhizopogon salebrosus TDB-379]